MTLSDTAFFRRTLIVLALIVGALLAWRLRDVAFLLFGSMLIALLLRLLVGTVKRFTPLGDGPALGVTVVSLVVCLGLAVVFFGWRMQAQVLQATELLPKGFHLFMEGLRANPLGSRLLEELHKLRIDSALPALGKLPSFAVSATTSAVGAVAMLVGGIYLAAQPKLYRDGLLRLLPAGARGWAGGLLDDAAVALRKWLLAQLVSMASIGVLVGIGMWAIGVQAPLVLGLFAGAAEFVPLVGPILGAIPALLLALLSGVDKAGWTLLMFVGVQQFESHVLIPLVQRQFAALPPVVTMFASLSFTLVFGPLGTVLGVPLTVVAVVVTKRLSSDANPPSGEQPAPMPP